MEKVTDKSKGIAQAFAAPLILRLLKNFSADQITDAVNENMRIVAWLKKNPQAEAKLHWILSWIPFSGRILNRVLPNIRSKPWIVWFINDPCKEKRHDLYLIFTYNPDAFKWLHSNLISLSKHLAA